MPNEVQPTGLELGRLGVCRGCGDVRGSIPVAPKIRQRCACEGLGDGDGPRYGDTNRFAGLCAVCAARIVWDGSRFSHFQCGACVRWIRRLNVVAGWVAIPISRHSLVNGSSLRGEDLLRGDDVDIPSIKEFAARVVASTNGASKLHAHRRQMTLRYLRRYFDDGSADVPLAYYLDVVARREPDPAPARFQLVERMTTG